MGNTTRHNLPYPVGTDNAGMGDEDIKNLAEALDTKLDIAKNADNRMKVVRNLALYDEGGTNLTGFIIINTKIPWGNHMTTLRIRGYVYQAHSNIIDLTVSFYPFNGDTGIYNAEASNKGSLAFTDCIILRRDSDGCVAIALKPDTNSQYWQYPKLWVDGMIGQTELADASIKTGWTITRVASLSGYTTKKTLPVGWQNITLLNGWVNYDGRTCQYIKTGDGWVRFRGIMRSGAVNPALCFQIPDGFRPMWRVIFDHHMIVSSDGGPGIIRIGGNGDVDYAGTTGYVDLSSLSYKVTGA